MIIRDSKNYPVESKIGDKFYVMKPHSHKEVSFGLIEEGVTRIIIEGEDFTLKKGDLIFIPPDSVHVCMPVEIDKFKFVMFYIDNDWFSREIYNDVYNLKAVFASTGLSGEEILSKHKDIKDSVQELIETFLTFSKKDDISIKNLEEIKDYINNNFTTDISLDEVASNYNINRYILSRKFKKEYNLSPKAYIINQRINRSKELLKTGTELTDVALNCGFYDLSHFIKTFKHYTGITPDSFR